MATNYTTKTAALKATIADIRQVAVGKKIEVGSGETTTQITKDSVSAEDLLISVDGKDERQSVKSLINDVSNKVDNMKMGIDIGTDTSESPEDDPDSGITNAPAAYSGVSKLNFRGEYVTVVEDPNTGEITLWLNKSTAYPEYKAVPRTGGKNIDSTSSVTVYTHDTDTFDIGTAGGTKTAYLADDTTANTNFGSSTWTLKSAADTGATATTGDTFRVASTQALFVRQTYEGTASDWTKIDLGVKAGKNYDISKNYADKNSDPYVSGTAKSVSAGAITVSYSAFPLTSTHAPNGRVPGTSECQAQITVNWDTLLTKDGGTATIEMAFDNSKSAAPADDKIVKLVNNRFFSEKKTATIANTPTVTYGDITNSDTISGLTYAKEGTKVSVGVTGITNTQWKVSNTSGNRLTVKASNGDPVTKTASDLTETSTKGKTHSDAVYATASNVVVTTKAESAENRGKCVVTITPVGYSSGTSKTVNLDAFWANYADSSGTYEAFCKETHRVQTAGAAAGTYASASSVDAAKTTVNGNDYISAVSQYGLLKHPSKAASDINNKSYSTLTADAAFLRPFSTGSVGTTFNLEGVGLTGSGVSVYWYEGKAGIWKLLCKNGTKADGQCSVSGDKITRKIDTGGGEENVPNVYIAIVMTSSAGNISPITFTRG